MRKRGHSGENLFRAAILGGVSIFVACGGSESNAGSGSPPATNGGSGDSGAAGDSSVHSGGSGGGSADGGSGAGGDGTNAGGNETSTGGNETSTGGNETSTGGNETSTGGNETSTGGNETSTGGTGSNAGSSATGGVVASGGSSGGMPPASGGSGIDSAGGGSSSDGGESGSGGIGGELGGSGTGGESGGGGVGGDSCLKAGKLEITSFIDGHDTLTIRPDALNFLHLSWAGPGMESFRRISTRVVVTLDGVASALEWCPEWPDAHCNTCDGSCGELRVSPIASAPLFSGTFVTAFGGHFLPAGVSDVAFTCARLQGGSTGSCTLAQDQGSVGIYVIDINDDSVGGPASYTATLSFQFDSCSQGGGGAGGGAGAGG